MPMRTKDSGYVYVDSTMRRMLPTIFFRALPFTQTGFALVANADNEWAIINTKGVTIVPYGTHALDLQVLQNLTLAMKSAAYEKKLPVWNWDWNIMSSDLKKTAPYVKVEIFVLETGQVLLKKDIPENENRYSLDCYPVDDKHVVLNDDLYAIEHATFTKVKRNISVVLEQGRYIPSAEGEFNMFDIKKSKAIFSGLVGATRIETLVNKQKFTFDSINMERFTPEVPKLLLDSKTGRTYAFPQYEKPFPKAIHNVTATQLAFLKDVSLIYSVSNTPYFVLGRFNYDHAVWAYDWLYLDADGKLLSEIKADNFYILDRVGYLVWPDKHLLFAGAPFDSELKIGKLKYVYESKNLYLVQVQKGDLKPTMGLWNSSKRVWDIEPIYKAIQQLDGASGIFAIQEQEGGRFYLYNNTTKQRIGRDSYRSISSNGYVESDKEQSGFFIDITTGVAYRVE